MYEKLESSARSLGAAFQKVNFLRDIKADFNGLARVYFPGCDFNNFTEQQKSQIEEDIHNDFRQAYQGITRLPLKARFGVYVAYKYYLSLFKKIKRMRTGPGIGRKDSYSQLPQGNDHLQGRSKKSTTINLIWNMTQVILVDENDKPIGTSEKMEAHVEGLLHRAFSVFIFNAKGEMLLAAKSFE